MQEEERTSAKITRHVPVRKIIALLAVSAAALFITTQVAPQLLLPGPPAEQPVASAPEAPSTPAAVPAAPAPTPKQAVAEISPPAFNPPPDEPPAPTPTQTEARMHELEEQLKHTQAENKLLLSTETIR